MPDYFDQIAARASEDKETARMGDHAAMPVHATPQVGSPDKRQDVRRLQPAPPDVG